MAPLSTTPQPVLAESTAISARPPGEAGLAAKLAAMLMPKSGMRPTLVVVAVVILWAAIAWGMLRPETIALDWNNGRQTDTQSIAINFTKDGGTPLTPRISWRGGGDGVVETEFQLYTYAIAAVMRVTGRAEWPGQLLSLLSVMLSGLVLYWHMRRTYGLWPAAAGVVGFLGIRTVPFLGTVVMPDALALCAFVIAWYYFSRYLDERRDSDLLAFACAGILAMLVKPTMAQLGIASFMLVCLRDLRALRSWKLWLTWIVMASTLVAYLIYAHHLFLTYGNTFGLLFGPESKMPTAEKLLDLQTYRGAVENAVRWGFGVPGAIAFGVLLLRRRVAAEHWALLISHAILVMLALKYMSRDAGNYYFAALTVAGASSLAAVFQDFGRLKWKQAGLLLATAAAVLLVVQVPRSAILRHFNSQTFRWDQTLQSTHEAGLALRGFASANDRVAVRSTSPRIDAEWKTPANFHDPRVFYVSDLLGWSFPSDETDPRNFDEFATAGARFVVDPTSDPSPALEVWLLSRHAQLIWAGTHGGRIWRLAGAPVLTQAGP